MDHRLIREGMTVFSSDGERLGKVIRRDEDGFLVEKGIFFHKDYLCSYSDIAGFSDRDILLTLSVDQLQALPRELWQPLPAPRRAEPRSSAAPLEQDLRDPFVLEAPQPSRGSVMGEEARVAASFAPASDEQRSASAETGRGGEEPERRS